MKDFTRLNAVILGCSGDSVDIQAKFKAKLKLNFPLLADPNLEAIENYGARRMKSFLGKSFLGIVRSTFWIGTEGKVEKIWPSVNPKGHAAEVLAALETRANGASAAQVKAAERAKSATASSPCRNC